MVRRERSDRTIASNSETAEEDLIEIPLFYGEDLESWLSWIEDFVSTHGFSDFETHQFAYGFIEGDAYTWYCDELSRSVFSSWEDLKRRLLHRFGKSLEEAKKQQEEVVLAHEDDSNPITSHVRGSLKLVDHVLEPSFKDSQVEISSIQENESQEAIDSQVILEKKSLEQTQVPFSFLESGHRDMRLEDCGMNWLGANTNQRSEIGMVSCGRQVFDQMPLGGKQVTKKRKRKRWKENVKMTITPCGKRTRLGKLVRKYGDHSGSLGETKMGNGRKVIKRLLKFAKMLQGRKRVLKKLAKWMKHRCKQKLSLRERIKLEDLVLLLEVSFSKSKEWKYKAEKPNSVTTSQRTSHSFTRFRILGFAQLLKLHKRVLKKFDKWTKRHRLKNKQKKDNKLLCCFENICDAQVAVAMTKNKCFQGPEAPLEGQKNTNKWTRLRGLTILVAYEPLLLPVVVTQKKHIKTWKFKFKEKLHRQNRVGASPGYLGSFEYPSIWRLHQGLSRFMWRDHSALRYRCRRYTTLCCARVLHVILSPLLITAFISRVMSLSQPKVATDLAGQLINDSYTFLLQLIGSLYLVLAMSEVLWQQFCWELQSYTRSYEINTKSRGKELRDATVTHGHNQIMYFASLIAYSGEWLGRNRVDQFQVKHKWRYKFWHFSLVLM